MLAGQHHVPGIESPMMIVLWRVAAGVFLPLIPTMAVFGNALVIMSVFRERSLQTVTNMLIVSLAVSDFMVSQEEQTRTWEVQRLIRIKCTAHSYAVTITLGSFANGLTTMTRQRNLDQRNRITHLAGALTPDIARSILWFSQLPRETSFGSQIFKHNIMYLARLGVSTISSFVAPIPGRIALWPTLKTHDVKR